MRGPPPLFLLLLAVVGAALLPTSVLAVCSDNTVVADCYAARASCSYNGTACIDGAPATCVAYLKDTVGCAAATGCAVNAFSSYCYTAPVACASIVSDPAKCALRGDCMVNATNTNQCLTGTATTRPSVYAADPPGCIAHGYTYDAFTPQTNKCVYNFTSGMLAIGATCNTYSQYPAPYGATACTTHPGCSYDLATDLCSVAVATVPVTLPTLAVPPLERDLGSTNNSGNTAYLVLGICIGAVVLVVMSVLIAGCYASRRGGVGTGPNAKKARSKGRSKDDQRPLSPQPKRSHSSSSVHAMSVHA